MDYFVKKGCYFEILCWCKTNPTPLTNNVWLPNIEYCLMFREKKCPLYGTYETKSKYYLSSINKDDKNEYTHPCCKPLTFIKNHIINSTKAGDVVLDPFLGSGTTAIACKELGRKYIGFEIDEKYYNIAKDRLNGINVKGQTDLFNTDFEQLQLDFDNNK